MIGSGAQWRDALNTAETGRLTQSANPGAIAKLAGKAAGVVGAVAKPLAAPLSAYQLYDAASEGRTGDAVWAGADLAASGALFTPAAPAAGAYLGARGLYEGAKMAGNAITSRMSSDTLDTIGGTINQALKRAGSVIGQSWGVNDDALLADKAQAAASAQQAMAATPEANPATQAAATGKPGPAGAPAPAPEADDTNPNRVKVERQSNDILSFSGGPNIGQDGGDITYTGGGGDRVSTVPGMNQAAINAALTNPDGSRWSAQDNAIMQANMRDGIDAYRGTSRGARAGVTSFGANGGNGILSNEYEAGRRTATAIEAAARLPRKSAAAALGVIGAREANAARLQSDQMQNATTARGQDITAANNGAQDQLAAQRLGLDGQRVGIESTRAENEGRKLAGDLELQGFGVRSAGRIESAQKTLLDPKATPEQRKLAKSTLAALSGKTAADRMQVVNLPDTETVNGLKIGGGQALIRTNEDGSVEQVPIGAQQVQAQAQAVQEGSISEVNGKKAKFTGGKWVPF